MHCDATNDNPIKTIKISLIYYCVFQNINRNSRGGSSDISKYMFSLLNYSWKFSILSKNNFVAKKSKGFFIFKGFKINQSKFQSNCVLLLENNSKKCFSIDIGNNLNEKNNQKIDHYFQVQKQNSKTINQTKMIKNHQNYNHFSNRSFATNSKPTKDLMSLLQERKKRAEIQSKVNDEFETKKSNDQYETEQTQSVSNTSCCPNLTVAISLGHLKCMNFFWNQLPQEAQDATTLLNFSMSIPQSFSAIEQLLV